MAANNRELEEIHDDAHVIIEEILDEMALKYMHKAAKNKTPGGNYEKTNIAIDKIIDEMKNP